MILLFPIKCLNQYVKYTVELVLLSRLYFIPLLLCSSIFLDLFFAAAFATLTRFHKSWPWPLLTLAWVCTHRTGKLCQPRTMFSEAVKKQLPEWVMRAFEWPLHCPQGWAPFPVCGREFCLLLIPSDRHHGLRARRGGEVVAEVRIQGSRPGVRLWGVVYSLGEFPLALHPGVPCVSSSLGCKLCRERLGFVTAMLLMPCSMLKVLWDFNKCLWNE